MKPLKLWRYSGAVGVYDQLIDRFYVAETYAVSKEKAISNIKYRYKQDKNLGRSAKVVLFQKVHNIPLKDDVETINEGKTVQKTCPQYEQRSLFDDFD